jgi:adenosylhomocysteine nucleosidase
MKRGCLGVVAAMPQEIAPLLRRIKGYQKERAAGFTLYRFSLQGVPVILVESGMGPAHAKAATETLISFARPALILNFGFAGAVQPGIEVGELVLAERVFWLREGRVTQAPPPDQQLAGSVLEACALAGISVKRGTFITAAGIMNKEEVAGSLDAGVSHPMLEMETAAVLGVSGQAGIPVVALRGVSDAANEELGFSIDEFCDGELRISPARVLRCIAGKPWIVPQLVRLAGNSRKAGKNLAIAVEVALKALTSG